MVRAVARPRRQGLLRAVVAVFLASGVVGGAGASRPAVGPRAPAPIVRVLTLEAGNFLLDESSGRILTVVGHGKRHTLVALDVRSGRQVRSVPLPPDNFPFLGGIDRPGRQLILIVGNAHVQLRDLDTLRLRRTVDLPIGRDIVGMTAVDGPAGRLFVAAYNPQNGLLPVPLFTVDTRRGTVLRTRMLDMQPPALEVDERAGRLYLTDQGHGTTPDTLDILDARTGRLLHTIRLDHSLLTSSPSLALDEDTGRVFVLQNDGSIAMVDGRSGRVLRTTQTGGADGIVADEPAGLVFTRSEGTGLDDGTINVLDSAVRRWTRALAAPSSSSTAAPSAPIGTRTASATATTWWACSTSTAGPWCARWTLARRDRAGVTPRRGRRWRSTPPCTASWSSTAPCTSSTRPIYKPPGANAGVRVLPPNQGSGRDISLCSVARGAGAPPSTPAARAPDTSRPTIRNPTLALTHPRYWAGIMTDDE